MKISSFNLKAKNYIKAGICAAVLTTSAVINKCARTVTPIILKDTVEFTHPSAAKLLTYLENGQRYSKTIYVPNQPAPNILSKDSIQNFKQVPKIILYTLKTLPDTMEVYYKVYCGKADKAIQKALGHKQNIVTAGNGVSGKDSIIIASGEKAGINDYISQHAADSLFNNAINQKDSILQANITPQAYKNLKQYEKDAVITYLYNVNENILKKQDAKRNIPESFFECLNQGKLAEVQSKFNIKPSAKEAEGGLAKRNLIQMLVFGNGRIYDNKYSIKTFENTLNIIKNRRDSKKIVKEILTILREYKVDEKNLCDTEQKIKDFMRSK